MGFMPLLFHVKSVSFNLLYQAFAKHCLKEEIQLSHLYIFSILEKIKADSKNGLEIIASFMLCNSRVRHFQQLNSKIRAHSGRFRKLLRSRVTPHLCRESNAPQPCWNQPSTNSAQVTILSVCIKNLVCMIHIYTDAAWSKTEKQPPLHPGFTYSFSKYSFIYFIFY